MPRDRPIEPIIAGWLNDLYLATVAGNAPAPDIKARIAVLTAALAKDFPDPALFGKETLLALSRQNRFFPGFADLSTQLNVWREEHRPRTFSVPIELTDALLSAEDRMAVRLWLERDADGSLSAQDMVMRLAVIRRHNEPGFMWLIAHNGRAWAMADRSGWLRSDDNADDYTDPGRILASVRNILDPPHPLAAFWLRALRAAVERHAPQYAELVPLDVSQTEADTAIGADRHPTPAQLADIQADDGIVRPHRKQAPSMEPGRRFGELTQEQLLATYEAAAKGGNAWAAQRAAMLREQIAKQGAENAG